MVMPRFLSKCLVLFCALLCNSVYASISLTPQSTEFSINDTINLTLEYTGNQNTLPSSQPDLAPLKELFEISGQQTQKSSSMSLQRSNGKTERITETRYKIILSATPIKEGKQTIPSIRWGTFTTQPIQVTVTPQVNTHNLGHGMQSNFFAEAEVTNASPYVQEQIILTVKVYSTTRFGNGGYGESFPSNVIAMLTNQKDKIYKTALNGQSYFVQERQYIVYTQRSGDITIPPITFTAQFPSNQVDSFGFRIAKTLRTRTQPIELSVRPMPSSINNDTWLPAKSVTLSQYLEKDEYEVGTPMTLTLSTAAEGVIAEQMPKPDLSALEKNFKIYPDQPELNSRWDNGAVISTRTDKVALIPLKAGNQIVPSVQIKWWDVKEDTSRTAKTTPINITVKPSTTDAPNTLPTLNGNTPAANNQAMMEKISQLENTVSTRVSTYWQYATLLLGGLSVILFIALLNMIHRLKGKKNDSTKQHSLTPTISTQDLLKRISNDPHNTSKQVILWARSHIDSSVNSLRDIVNHCNQSAAHKELATALVQLNKAIYGEQQQTHWHSKALKSALKSFKPIAVEPTETHSFLKLYPEN